MACRKKTSKQRGEYHRLRVLLNQQASREDLHPTTAQIEYQPHETQTRKTAGQFNKPSVYNYITSHVYRMSPDMTLNTIECVQWQSFMSGQDGGLAKAPASQGMSGPP